MLSKMRLNNCWRMNGRFKPACDTGRCKGRYQGEALALWLIIFLAFVWFNQPLPQSNSRE